MKRNAILTLTAALLFAGCASTRKTTSFDILTAELTEAQKTDAATKYYHLTPIAPNAELAAAIETQLLPEQMVSPEDVSSVFDIDAPFINGYGVMGNGVTYSAAETVMTGVTPEIFSEYYKWANSYNDQELIYKIWFPGWHYSQKMENNRLVVYEDIGQGIEEIHMKGGIQLDRTSFDSRIIEAYMTNSTNITSEGKEINGILLHVKYVNADGYISDRCVAWFGVNLVDGKMQADTANITEPLSRAHRMAQHSAGENSNLTAVMLEYHADTSNR